MSKHKAYIALGSNLGDREANIRQALQLLQEEGLTLVRVSSLITTEPYGVLDQPRFLNGVCEVETELEAVELLRLLLSVEQRLGRVRVRHWGERNIDLDLLLFDAQVLRTEELTLPHPDMQNRDFVLVPLAELAPQAVHPVLGKTIAQLKEELLGNDKISV